MVIFPNNIVNVKASKENISKYMLIFCGIES